MKVVLSCWTISAMAGSHSSSNSNTARVLRPVALGFTRDTGELIQVGTDKRGLYSRTAEDEMDGSGTQRSGQNNSAAKKRKTTEYGTPFFGMAVIPNTKMIECANRVGEKQGNMNSALDMVVANSSHSYDWPVKYHPIDVIITNILQQDLHELNLEQAPSLASVQQYIGVPVSGDMITALSNESVYKDVMKRSLGVTPAT